MNLSLFMLPVIANKILLNQGNYKFFITIIIHFSLLEWGREQTRNSLSKPETKSKAKTSHHHNICLTTKCISMQ